VEGRGREALSYAQQRLWFLDQLHPGTPFYNIRTAVRLRGKLDTSALEKALRGLVERHEALRTRFPVVDGEAVQDVLASCELELERVDADGEAEARRVIEKAAARPFDLSTGPLMRAVLVRVGDGEHLLLLSMHHIVSDGWSMGILVREATELYAAHCEGREPRLPELKIQYADYAAWQREWLKGEVLEEQIGYWRERLSGAPAAPELPTDRPRPAAPTLEGATQRFTIPEATARRLRGLCRSQGATPFMTLLAALKVLLRHGTGMTDIVVGTNVANRTRQESEGLIGFFINQLVLRTQVDGDPTFLELLGRVRETTLGAYAHQDLPFDMLVAALRPERSITRSPFFQVKLDVTDAIGAVRELAGLTVEKPEPVGIALHSELHIFIEDGDGALEGAILYEKDLFDAATIARFAESYRTVVDTCVDRPERPLSEVLMLLAESDRRHAMQLKHAYQGAFQERLRRAQGSPV
jgi:hypothetical protein